MSCEAALTEGFAQPPQIFGVEAALLHRGDVCTQVIEPQH